MKESFIKLKNQIIDFWQSRTMKQKTVYISLVVLIIIAATVIVFLTSRPNMVPLYSDLTPSETGSIKENLDGRGVKSEIGQGGKTILVPKEMVDTLKVELAAEGIPKTGSIDYSFFSENASFGMTDNEFDVIKQDAMQNEIANLIKEIEGVQDAKVMITLPDKEVFVSDTKEEASASIVLNTKPGQEFDENQIKSLYHLISKSVPNLPTDNIVIMNQYFEYYDLKNSGNNTMDNFASQNEIKKEIERDVQRRVQTMLGTIMGREKVVASVTADVDFTQENREENLVTPVDEENMKGIAISAQKLTETYSGDAAANGGSPVTEDPSDSLGTQYREEDGGNGDYEKTEETINNEVNRIRKEIKESPYKIRDLGIQVMVEPPKANDVNSLSQERIDDITEILGTIIRTSINKSEGQPELTDDDITQKIAVSVQPFNGKVSFTEKEKNVIPLWVYIVGGILILAIILLGYFLLRNRKQRDMEMIEYEEPVVPIDLPDVNEELESESSLKRKQLEKMAMERPDEFAKLLRSWIAEE